MELLNQQPIFIGGAGRSGTTLVRVILDSHSNIACGPELKVTPVLAQLWRTFQTQYIGFLKPFDVDSDHIDKLFRNFISGLLEPLKQKTGKARIAEKSPNNVFYFEHLHRIFPEAHFIHVIRDPRDVVSSLLKMDWKSPDGKPIPYTQNAEAAAKYWVGAIEAAKGFESRRGSKSRYLEIQYEKLVSNSEDAIRGILNFLEEPWEDQLLDFHQQPHDLAQESSSQQVNQKIHQKSIKRWKTDLSEEDQNTVYQIAGPWLRKLGYE